MRGTLTSSGLDSVHTSMFTILLFKPCTVAITQYSGHSSLEIYARVVAFEPDLQRASFYGMTDILPYTTIAKLLPLYTYEKVLFEPQNLATMTGSRYHSYICYGAQVHAGLPRQSVLPTEAIH